MSQPYKYFAFISYSSRDTEWGKRVQRKLEHYRLPATLCSERGWQRKPMNPVFFAPTDIQPGGLSAELQERLRASRHLIVICSPHSAQSAWVGKEIAFFHSLGRTANLHFFIVSGQPHSANPDTECFNPVVDSLGLPEILGANVNERVYRWPWLNRERAYVQLITKLLGVEFDTIWQRHRRLLVRQLAAWCLGVVAVVAALIGVWLGSQPFNTTVSLSESSSHNAQLPPLRDAVVTLTLGDSLASTATAGKETKTDTIAAIGDEAVFCNIPRHFLGSKVRITLSCADYLPVDTILTLQRNLTLSVSRDASVYGHLSFLLWNPVTEMPCPHQELLVDGLPVQTDASGRVELSIPLERQRTSYPVSAGVALEDDSLYMPCNSYTVIRIKN